MDRIWSVGKKAGIASMVMVSLPVTVPVGLFLSVVGVSLAVPVGSAVLGYSVLKSVFGSGDKKPVDEVCEAPRFLYAEEVHDESAEDGAAAEVGSNDHDALENGVLDQFLIIDDGIVVKSSLPDSSHSELRCSDVSAVKESSEASSGSPEVLICSLENGLGLKAAEPMGDQAGETWELLDSEVFEQKPMVLFAENEVVGSSLVAAGSALEMPNLLLEEQDHANDVAVELGSFGSPEAASEAVVEDSIPAISNVVVQDEDISKFGLEAPELQDVSNEAATLTPPAASEIEFDSVVEVPTAETLDLLNAGTCYRGTITSEEVLGSVHPVIEVDSLKSEADATLELEVQEADVEAVEIASVACELFIDREVPVTEVDSLKSEAEVQETNLAGVEMASVACELFIDLEVPVTEVDSLKPEADATLELEVQETNLEGVEMSSVACELFTDREVPGTEVDSLKSEASATFEVQETDLEAVKTASIACELFIDHDAAVDVSSATESRLDEPMKATNMVLATIEAAEFDSLVETATAAVVAVELHQLVNSTSVYEFASLVEAASAIPEVTVVLDQGLNSGVDLALNSPSSVKVELTEDIEARVELAWDGEVSNDDQAAVELSGEETEAPGELTGAEEANNEDHAALELTGEGTEAPEELAGDEVANNEDQAAGGDEPVIQIEDGIVQIVESEAGSESSVKSTGTLEDGACDQQAADEDRGNGVGDTDLDGQLQADHTYSGIEEAELGVHILEANGHQSEQAVETHEPQENETSTEVELEIQRDENRQDAPLEQADEDESTAAVKDDQPEKMILSDDSSGDVLLQHDVDEHLVDQEIESQDCVEHHDPASETATDADRFSDEARHQGEFEKNNAGLRRKLHISTDEGESRENEMPEFCWESNSSFLSPSAASMISV